MTTRVLLADDHAILRAGLAMLIEAQDDLVVVGEAADGIEAVDKTRKLKPDVVILDLTMPRLSGLEALREIRHDCPDTGVLVLTIVVTMGGVAIAIASTAAESAGAGVHALETALRGVLIAVGILAVAMSALLVALGRRGRRQAADRELLLAIRTVREGRHFVDLSQAEAMLPNPGPLSQREQQVLTELAQGFTHQEIADRLALSIKTVETYLARLSSKLGLHRRADLVRYALDVGLLSGEARARATS